MSIIYEALKKAEKAINSEVGPRAKNASGHHHPPKPFLLFLLWVSIILFTGNSLFIFLTWPKPKVALTKEPLQKATEIVKDVPQKEPVESVPMEAAQEAAVQDSRRPVISESKIPPPVLILSGVFYAKDEGYALINNQIVRIGDSVEGAVLKKINPPDEVELEYAEGKIKLSTRSR